MLLDIHTHNISLTNEVSIRNFYGSFETIPNNVFFSAGLHPWFLQKATAITLLYELKKLMSNGNMLAVGECGLDKSCATDFNFQKEIFVAQIKIAKKYEKPLVIHCVRSFDEVIQLLDMEEFKLPVVFHGFNKSKELAKKLITKNYFLSFGIDLLNPRVSIVFKSVPADNFLLETDDADISIEEIYITAAKLRNQSLNELEGQIQKNAKLFFSNNLSLFANQSI